MTFLALVIFWSIFEDIMDQKMTGAKKNLMKNQFFHARQSRRGIFEIGSYSGLISMVKV